MDGEKIVQHNDYMKQLVRKIRNTAKQLLMDFGLSSDEANSYLIQVEMKISYVTGRDIKFLPGVVRWSLSHFDIHNKSECDRIQKLLYNLRDMPIRDDYDGNFNGQSPEEVIKNARLDIDAEEYHTPADVSYSVVPGTLSNLSKYEGHCDWCILDEAIFDFYGDLSARQNHLPSIRA